MNVRPSQRDPISVALREQKDDREIQNAQHKHCPGVNFCSNVNPPPPPNQILDRQSLRGVVQNSAAIHQRYCRTGRGETASLSISPGGIKSVLTVTAGRYKRRLANMKIKSSRGGREAARRHAKSSAGGEKKPPTTVW